MKDLPWGLGLPFWDFLREGFVFRRGALGGSGHSVVLDLGTRGSLCTLSLVGP